MKKKKNISAVAGGCAVVVVALALRSCISDTNPIGVSSNNLQGEGLKNRIDSVLDRLGPQFTITPDSGNSYMLAMTVGAGGSPDSPGLKELPTINAVQFDVYTPGHARIATERCESISSSGVSNPATGELSIIAHAGIRYTPASPLPEDAYATMIVIGTNGIVMRNAAFPNRPPEH